MKKLYLLTLTGLMFAGLSAQVRTSTFTGTPTTHPFIDASQYSVDRAVGDTLLYVPLALTYVSFYSLLQYDSPSLTIISMVEKAGPLGCQRSMILENFKKKNMVRERMEASVHGGLILVKDNSYFLTKKGLFLAQCAHIFSRILRLESQG